MPASRTIRRLWLGAAVVVATSLQPMTVTAQTPACQLRFDGVYHFEQPAGARVGLRFFKNGTVEIAGGGLEQAVGTLSAIQTGRGKFVLKGCELRAEVISSAGVWSTLAGTIESETVNLGNQSPNAVPTPRRYTFNAADFREATRKTTSGAAPAAGPAPDVRFGRATMDNACENIAFEPVAPAIVPSTAKDFAVELRNGFPDVAIRGGALCRAKGVQTRTCNRYAVVNGQPALSSQTVVVACQDGGAFAPGNYTAVAGGTTLSFAIK